MYVLKYVCVLIQAHSVAAVQVLCGLLSLRVPATLFIYKGQNYVYHTVQVRNSYVLVETYHSSVAIGMETSSAHVLGCRGKYTPQLSKTIHQETYSSGNFVNHNFIFILLDMLAIKL